MKTIEEPDGQLEEIFFNSEGAKTDKSKFAQVECDCMDARGPSKKKAS